MNELISISYKGIKRRIKSKSDARNWRLKSVKNTWRSDQRRSSLLKLSWSRNNRMKWMLSRKSLRLTWTSDWSCVRLSTTNCSRDTRTLRRKLKTNRILRELSSRKHSRTTTLDQWLLRERAWWAPEWDLECKDQRWREVKVAALLATQPRDHLIIDKRTLYFLPSCLFE